MNIINKIDDVMTTIGHEPYRLFFPLGIWMGMVGLSPWLLYAFGWSKTYSGFFHSSVQMLVYMNCFVIGFLMTFIPRFTASSYATRREVISFLFLLIGMAIFFRKENWVIAEGCYIVWLLLLVSFVLKRIPKKNSSSNKNGPPVELIWIPVAVVHGVVGSLMLIFCQLKLLPTFIIGVGKSMMEQGFILSVVIGIGGFLIPRIMGVYKSDQAEKEDDSEICLKKYKVSKDTKKLFLNFLLALGLFVSFWLEGLGYLTFGYGLRAGVITMVFGLNGIIFQIPKTADFYVWLAWISSWMLTLGFWLAAIFENHSVAMLHISFLGGFSLMVFAIGTMVIMSHAGKGQLLHRPLWILWVVVLGILLVLSKRMLVIFWPDVYFKFLGMASSLWIAVAFCWLIFMIPYLLRVPSGDEFEHMHEEAKERLKKA